MSAGSFLKQRLVIESIMLVVSSKLRTALVLISLLRFFSKPLINFHAMLPFIAFTTASFCFEAYDQSDSSVMELLDSRSTRHESLFKFCSE